MREVRLTPEPLTRLASVVPPDRFAAFERTAAELRERLDGRSIVNVNSTPAGGGVAEMLRWMLPYGRGAGVDTRWFVIDGDPDLFAITKRLHHRLHGTRGDDGPLGPAEADHLRTVARVNADELKAVVDRDDVLVVHDPQPLGLMPHCATWGVPAVWRCHIGTRTTNEHTEQAWEFLRPFLEEHVDQFVFTDADYAPPWIPVDRLSVIRPSIDPISPKNDELAPDLAVDVLQHVGIVSGSQRTGPPFRRSDGSPGRVDHFADIIRTGPAPTPHDPLVVQVSRWDPLKDMGGVMRAFAEQVLDGTRAHLVLAGPVVTSVADDPTAAAELERTWESWRRLPHHARARVQLVCLPMSDADENAAIVNALQTHATVVTQKSLQEGFGLTVSEAMFKRSAVVASAVGGISLQIEDGVDGLLIDDPLDLAGFGAAVASLLDDAERRDAIGDRARASVITDGLPDTALVRWGEALHAAVEHHHGRTSSA